MTIFSFGRVAVLPRNIAAGARVADWNGIGMSVMEMSHRGKVHGDSAAAERFAPAVHPGKLQGVVSARRGALAVCNDPAEFAV